MIYLGNKPVGVALELNVATKRIEVGENSVTAMPGVTAFFREETENAPFILSIALDETPTAENQFCGYAYNTETYGVSAQRYRNGAIGNVNWNSYGYDAVLLVGTHYTVTYIPNLNE